ncbi:MAG TPA: FHA domain-containing protein [Anaerolineales bacterium]|nr:FHA domain-containing protein [Anaerolineales bacterium]
MADPWQIILRVLPAVPLYVFLGALLVILWRDRESAKSPGSQAVAAHLQQEGEGETVVYSLHEVNLLGRAADNTIHLTDKSVSAYHARLSFHAGQWWLEDLGSRNGTRVNRFRLEGPMVVTFGDVIHVGAVPLVLSPGLASSSPGSTPAAVG